ncbi:hypothetical protein M427DRAFT_51564, partial [Gonapodya prolifera JEL478]
PHILAIVSTDNRLIVPGIEVLCIVLRHLSFPTHLDDLSKEFGCEGSNISQIYQWDTAHICTLFSDVLYWDKNWLTSEFLQEYADAVWDSGAPYVYCFGFMDGMVWQICRPLQQVPPPPVPLQVGFVDARTARLQCGDEPASDLCGVEMGEGENGICHSGLVANA